MKVLHLISGGETGGSKNHLLSLIEGCESEDIYLGVFQEGQLAEDARQRGIQVTVFGQSSRYDFSILTKIKKIIIDNHITIVHTHGPRANLFTFILRRMTSFKWITTIHSDPRQDFLRGGMKGKIFTLLNMTILKKIDHFFAVSERFKNMIVDFGIPSKKITTIYNGISYDIPLQKKISREELSISNNEFVLIMVARLHPIKGHSVVFDALKSLIHNGNDVRFLLVGDGPLREELEQEVVDKGLSEKVSFLGFQSDVHSYLALSDIKLLASYSESFPLVILEAARAQTPVISTDVGGVKDLISDSTLGWIVPIKDAEAIEKAVEEAISLKMNKTLHILGENLYKKASSLYSIKQLVQNTMEVYKKL